MAGNFADRLNRAIADKGTPTCVGLDPVYARLPESIRKPHEHLAGDTPEAQVAAILQFCQITIAGVANIVPVVKINIAYFEIYGALGIDAYLRLIEAAHEAGLLVIGDVKRADVGHSSAAYARAQLSGENAGDRGRAGAPDAVTVNPYLGLDGIEPFLKVCRDEGKGIFALVQTSNPSAAEVQDVPLDSGETVATHVGRLVNRWAEDTALMGADGYSAVGAVVSPRDVESARALRTVMDRSIFLVPGYGAQGQAADRVAHCFKADGTGAIVNSSRGVIYAYENERYAAVFGRNELSWLACVQAACDVFVHDIHGVLNR